MTTARIVLSTLALSLAATACAQDDSGVFSEATYQDRGMAIETAAGAPAQVALLQVFLADISASDDDGCVTRVEDGDTVTLAGQECDSTNANFSGSVVVRGWADFVDEDSADAISMTFSNLAVLDDDGTPMASVDGTIEMDQRADGSGTTTFDLSADFMGTYMTFAGTLVCPAGSGPCQYDDVHGSTDALGEFTIAGSLRERDGERTGTLELVGDQRMTVDFDAATEGCAPVTIDGEAAADHCWMDGSIGAQQ